MSDHDPGEFSLRDAFSKKLRDFADEILAESRRDRSNSGSSVGPLTVDLDEDRTNSPHRPRPSALLPMKVFQSDGRTRVILLAASFQSRPRKGRGEEIVVRVEHDAYTDNDETWERRFRELAPRNLIVNHKFYSIGQDRRDKDGNLLPGGGFGGRLVRFRRLFVSEDGNIRSAGDVEETRDLWFGGVVPPAWRDRLPDNAVFVAGFDGPTVMY